MAIQATFIKCFSLKSKTKQKHPSAFPATLYEHFAVVPCRIDRQRNDQNLS